MPVREFHNMIPMESLFILQIPESTRFVPQESHRWQFAEPGAQSRLTLRVRVWCMVFFFFSPVFFL